MSALYCTCRLCKENSNSGIIYWKQGKYNNYLLKDIHWKRTSLISWQGRNKSDHLIVICYICIYYYRVYYNINARPVSPLFINFITFLQHIENIPKKLAQNVNLVYD